MCGDLVSKVGIWVCDLQSNLLKVASLSVVLLHWGYTPIQAWMELEAFLYCTSNQIHFKILRNGHLAPMSVSEGIYNTKKPNKSLIIY